VKLYRGFSTIQVNLTLKASFMHIGSTRPVSLLKRIIIPFFKVQ